MVASAEEEIAKDFICSGTPDVTVIVTDATCLEHNLNLVLHILTVSDKVIVCVNLLDEATNKGIRVDLRALSDFLRIPVRSKVHFPCATTCLTIKKETRSLEWTLLSMAIPTATGLTLCLMILFTQELQNFKCVGVRLSLFKDLKNHSLFINDVSRSDNSHRTFAIEFLFLPHIIRLNRGKFRIGQ